MKTKYAFTFLVLLELTIGNSKGQGIEFQKETWAMVLQQAKTEGKFIFVDVYTTWCGPCKWMEENVFNTRAVGDFYNPHFINYRLDAEKGEGIALAEKYETYAFPTYLFFNPAGELVYVTGASMEKEAFLEEGRKAFTSGTASFALYNLAVKAENILLDHPNDSLGVKQAIGWIENSLKIRKYFFNTYLAARLYNLLNDEDRARRYARSALKKEKEIKSKIKSGKGQELQGLL